MKEHPILFSASMVRALLDGSKTQTRRVFGPERMTWSNDGQYETHALRDGELVCTGFGPFVPNNWLHYCPYGQVGDRLWVRESFWGCDAPGYGDQPCVVYDDEWYGKEYRPAEIRPWARKFGRIPSIHMPRDCSRITLDVTSVRVERLQSISEVDALAEGIRQHDQRNGWVNECTLADGKRHFDASAYGMFQQLWADINGADSWNVNPWVWVIEFKRLG